MNKVFSLLLVVAPLALVATPTLAASSVDNFAATAISAAQYDRAIAQLEGTVKRDSFDEAAWLNLATAYRKVGRHSDAEKALRRVMALEDTSLETAAGSFSSHAMARRAMAQPVGFASR